MANFGIVNMETGEIIRENVQSWRTSEQDRVYRMFKTNKQTYALDTQAGRYFTFIFTGEAIKEQYTLSKLSRLGAIVVLSTYILSDSKGVGIAKLSFKSAAECAKVLNCSTRQAQLIWSDLEKVGAAYKDETGLYMNSGLVYRGSTKRNDIVKVFHMNTRELLEKGLKIADIGLLFLTAPYIDRETNYLCNNPNAGTKEAPELIGFNELAKIVNVDEKTLRSKFKKMSIIYKGKEVPVYLKVENPLSNKTAYLMNPLVINRGMSDNYITDVFVPLFTRM